MRRCMVGMGNDVNARVHHARILLELIPKYLSRGHRDTKDTEEGRNFGLHFVFSLNSVPL
jgi:hypothetical protein